MDELRQAKFTMWRMVLLLWIISGTGCAERESTDSDNRHHADAAIRSDETVDTQANGEPISVGVTTGAPKISDGCEITTSPRGVHFRSLQHGGWVREYVMVVPELPIQQDFAYPLLIAMHGFGGNGVSMRNMLARERRFEDGYVVVYPDGAGFTNSMRGWNSGHPQCCGTALQNNVDDVAFIRALVDSVAHETCIDLNRVYATGFSNGGDMAQRLACDASDLVAAVTSVAGRFDYHATACPGERPVPTVLYRGRSDRTVPYETDVLSLFAISTIPAMKGFGQIAANHRCEGDPTISLSSNGTRCIQMDDCDAGFEITLCTSEYAGHCWPGIANCSKPTDEDSEDFDASNHMKSFFPRHRFLR